MTEALLERPSSGHNLNVEPESVLQVGWELGSETPVQGMVDGTEPESRPTPPTNMPPLERLSAGLANAVKRLKERDSVTPFIIGNWIDDPIRSVAREALIIERPPAEGVLSRMLRRSLLGSWHTEFPELVAAPTRVRLRGLWEPEATPALTPLQAARELKDWLGLSWTELAAAARLNDGTIHYWQRTPDAVPRPATVAPLYELHSLTNAARRELSSEGEFRAWLHTPGADTSPLAALRSANVEDFRKAAQGVVFGHTTGSPAPAPSRTWRDDDEPELTSAPATTPRRAARRRSRARLT